MPACLDLSDIGHSFGVMPLFDQLELHIQQGERLAIIGANGSGKSTLLQIIAGKLRPDSGSVIRHQAPIIVQVHQEDRSSPEASVGEICAAAQASGGELSPRALRLLHELGFVDLQQKAGELSGGWRKRLALAAGFLAEADLLLLDEPTNHLDLGSILWLQEYLQRYRGTVVLVSHDRYFLDRVATRVVEIGRQFPGGTFAAAGGYSDFLISRDAFLSGQRAEQDKLANKLRREDAWLARRPKARTTKAVARIKGAERLRSDLAALDHRNNAGRSAEIAFQSTGRRGNELIVGEGLSKAYGERRLFSGLNCSLAPGERLGLVGNNGSGKSTLLRLLAGTETPDAGSLKRAHELRVVTFAQDRSQLRPELTLRQSLCPNGEHVELDGRQLHVAAYARMFLFDTGRLEQTVGSLSGGEQARLLIALLMLEPADVLLLDEPTNDLDIPSLEALQEALAQISGAVVLVTHDRYLLQEIADRVIALEDGEARHFASYQQWEESLRTRGSTLPRAEPSAVASTETAESAAAGKLSWQEQKELRGIDKRIVAAEAEVAKLEQALLTPAVYTDSAAVAKHSRQLQTAQEKVDGLYQRWQELEERPS